MNNQLPGDLVVLIAKNNQKTILGRSSPHPYLPDGSMFVCLINANSVVIFASSQVYSEPPYIANDSRTYNLVIANNGPWWVCSTDCDMLDA